MRRSSSSSGGTITQAGAGIGTPAYMAPEQAIGDPATDHRADVYAFGCLGYELFAGHPPFHGLPAHQIIAAHVGTKPVALSDVCPDAPDAVVRLVGRCLEKDPAARLQSAHELAAALVASQTQPNDAVRRQHSRAALWIPLLLAAGIGTRIGFERYCVVSALLISPGHRRVGHLRVRRCNGRSEGSTRMPPPGPYAPYSNPRRCSASRAAARPSASPASPSNR